MATKNEDESPKPLESSLGTANRPFAAPNPSEEQIEEMVFMRQHGGWAATRFYRVLDALGSILRK